VDNDSGEVTSPGRSFHVRGPTTDVHCALTLDTRWPALTHSHHSYSQISSLA